MRIRAFRKQDAPSVSSLIRRCLRTVNSKNYPPRVISFMCAHFTPKKLIENAAKRKVVVAVEGNLIAGTASVKDNVILTVFVDPRVHGKRIGTRLMQRVESIAKRQGYKSVKLPSSLTAVEFYKRLGYKGTVRKHEKNYGTTILMRKRL